MCSIPSKEFLVSRDHDDVHLAVWLEVCHALDEWSIGERRPADYHYNVHFVPKLVPEAISYTLQISVWCGRAVSLVCEWLNLPFLGID